MAEPDPPSPWRDGGYDVTDHYGIDPALGSLGDFAELRERMSWRRGDAVFLAEANVPNDDLVQFFGDADGAANRLQMMFAFRLNEALLLSLAREDPEPVGRALATLPPLPRHGQWAVFLRNHDEVDLSQLSEAERQEVFAAFGPQRRQQLYGRGIRRRLATMLNGGHRRLRMAYSLQFTMPGTPVLRYGDEIGMGEDLRLPERDAIRTPMMLHTRRECGEIGIGHHGVIPVEPAHVLAHRAEAPSGSLVFLDNLADRPARVGLPEQPDADDEPVEVFSDREYPHLDLNDLELDGYGFRWIRLRRTHAPH
ncbi:hypothetical protein [Dactylosporangium sp. CA-092794]|uniref:hypothetical protein n=1 Tax=Dactylosporangium sp. CA-092794 TaxID=3239929 RepID=UPI003D90F095